MTPDRATKDESVAGFISVFGLTALLKLNNADIMLCLTFTASSFEVSKEN